MIHSFLGKLLEVIGDTLEKRNLSSTDRSFKDHTHVLGLLGKNFYGLLAKLSQVLDYGNPSPFHGLDLGLGCSTGTTNDCSRVAHSSARRRG
jgi:hypothetical protein